METALPKTGDANQASRRDLYRCAKCGASMDHRVTVFPKCPLCLVETSWVLVKVDRAASRRAKRRWAA
jgi:DNA-directed RNA polymerase subunit RPC12/RpoP